MIITEEKVLAALSHVEDPDLKKDLVTLRMIKDVKIEGVSKINSKKFLKQMANRPGKVYKAQKKMEDIYNATTYARNLGFYDFSIDEYNPVLSEDSSEVIITVKVTEGSKHVYNSIKLIFIGCCFRASSVSKKTSPREIPNLSC